MKRQAGLFKRSLLIMITLLATISSCACQPTPDKSAVNNRNNPSNTDAEKSISGNLLKSDNPEKSFTPNDKVTAHVEYGSNTLIVDAEICVPQRIKAPQVRVGLKDFKDGDTMKEFVESIYPNAKIYDDDGVRTPDEITSEIVYVKQLLSIAKEDPVVESETRIIVTYDLDVLQNSLSSLEEEYRLSQNHKLQPPVYEFQNDNDGTFYSTFRCELPDGSFKNLIIQNSGEGNLFRIEADNTIINQEDLYLSADEVIKNKDFISAKELADAMIKKVGANNMMLNAACYGTVIDDRQTEIKNAAHCLYYVPEYNGIPLTYATNYIGTSAVNVDGNDDVYMNLIEPEYIRICVYNGQIDSVFWQNPLKVLNVEIEDCDLLPWSDIEDLFYTQSSRIFEDKGAYSNSTINVNRIEFGLTKVLIQNEGNSYRLIPAWSFFGTIIKKGESEDEPSDVQEMCLVTIDAVNGDFIDRGLMY